LRSIFLLVLLFTLSFADIFRMNSFQADFRQTVTNDKGNKLQYSGHVKAIKPQYALWTYDTPSKKSIYIVKNRATIIEPDLEQVIIRSLHSSIDFFNIIKQAKKINSTTYTTEFQSINYTIKTDKTHLKSIQYTDELDNSISILFTNQIENAIVQEEEFYPNIPEDYDIING